MQLRTVLALSATIAVTGHVHARNAADLKRDLEKILLPTGGKAIRMAYIKCEQSGFKEFAANAVDGTASTVVYVVSSEDGVVRRLYPASGSGKFVNVSITADGNKVLFLNRATDQCVVVPWAGGAAQTLNVGGMMQEYWRNPADGSDWAIVFGGGISRVNIANPSQKVVLFSSGAGVSLGDDGTGLSDDGKKLLVYNTNGGTIGLWDLTAKTYAAGRGGCQPSMRAGLPYRYGHNISHSRIYSFSEGAATIDSFNSSKRVNDSLKAVSRTISCGGEITNEGGRYTQHRDFVTFCMSQSSVNPILMRLPDMAFVYVEDGLTCRFTGDMDAVVLSSVGTSQDLGRTANATGRYPGGGEAFSIDGRRLRPAAILRTSPSRASERGVVILRDAQGKRAVRTTVAQ